MSILILFESIGVYFRALLPCEYPQVKEKEKNVVLKMLLYRRSKGQQKIKMAESNLCYFLFSILSIWFLMAVMLGWRLHFLMIDVKEIVSVLGTSLPLHWYLDLEWC